MLGHLEVFLLTPPNNTPPVEVRGKKNRNDFDKCQTNIKDEK